jgi:hypothetical protein
MKRKIVWSAVCRCGAVDVPHRHGTGSDGSKLLSILRPKRYALGGLVAA